MNVDDILQQLEELFDRARAALEQQVSTAHKAVASLNQEKAAATKAVTELQAQHGKAHAELNAAMNNLDRVLSLGAIQAEIKKAGKELEQLKSEATKELKTLEVLVKKRTQEEARVAALEVAAREATAKRCRAQDLVKQIKTQLGV